MRLFSAPNSLSHQVAELKSLRKSIGLVPTMGALHEGHLSLIRKAREENDVVIVSIFVNPLQFNNTADLSKYPRTLDSDIEVLKNEKIEFLFAPSEIEMYPSTPSISIHFGDLANRMEGKHRKGHFEGVGVVVSKLFHITNPNKAYFGLKDLQQFLLIKKMCSELNFPTEVVGVDTVRNENGLALSSRNARLSKQGLEIAPNIYKGLINANEGINQQKSIAEIRDKAMSFYKTIPELEIEYFEIVNTLDLQSIDTYDDVNELAICVAGYVDGIRLIDNLYLRLK